MNILVVCQYFHPEQFRVNDVCLSFQQAGHQVTVITGLPNYPTGIVPKEYRHFQKRKEIVEGIRVRRLPIIPRKPGTLGVFLNYLSFTIASSIYSVFCQTDYDAIYVYQLSPVTMALPAIIISKRSHRNVFLYCLDLWPESLVAKSIGEKTLLYKTLLKLSRWIYRNVTKIAVSSESFKKYFEETLHIPAKSIDFLPQYAENLFEALPPASHGDTVVLTFAGNIGEMQSVETIVRAACLTQDIPNLCWKIVGDGSARKRCMKMAEDFGLKNLQFEGFHRLDEMPAFYLQADAMLLTLAGDTTISYTLPGKLQSYMAAGKPILGAVDGEAQRVIQESGCGLCCRAEDAEGLAHLARDFVSHPESHAVYARNSRSYYDQNFRKELFMEKTLDILMNLKN